MRSRSARAHQSAVIAGAGNGLGRDLALGLARQGYIVFGTAASADEAAELRAASKGRVSLIVCHMRKDAPIAAWAGGVSDAVGNAGVDILIVVGAGLKPALDKRPLSEAGRHGLDDYVFVTAFLPALRKARGRVVLIGSAMQGAVPSGRKDLAPPGVDIVAIAHDALVSETSAATVMLGMVAASGQHDVGDGAARLLDRTPGTSRAEKPPAPAAMAGIVERAEQRSSRSSPSLAGAT